MLASTVDELEQARAELRRLEERWDNYTGNNPIKFRSAIEIARQRMSLLEARLEILKKRKGEGAED